MPQIEYIDRQSGKKETEEVYGGKALDLLYGDSFLSRFLHMTLLPLIVKLPFVSQFYGYLQRRPSSKKKVAPFVEAFGVDPSEFADEVDTYESFDAFFTRKLKPEARPIAEGNDVAILPADGRYLFYQNVAEADGIVVKGKKFDLGELLDDQKLAERYETGSLAIARLCPTDYHRYHFPCACRPAESRWVNGYWSSVNPIALKRNVSIFTENKRLIAPLQTEQFGKVQLLQVGATNVGTIHTTHEAGRDYAKGDEMGFFAFGGSALVLLFEPGRIRFDDDLLAASASHTEMKCLMGQSMGQAL